MYSIKIFLRKEQVNKDGKSSITLRLIKNRKKRYYSLRIYVQERDWSSTHLRVKKSDRDYLRKNRLITKFVNKAKNIIDSFFLNDKDLTFSIFKNLFQNDGYDDSCFYNYSLDKIENRKIKHETKKAYKSQINKLKTFRKQLSFSDLTPHFIHQYRKYLSEVIGNNENTINKGLRILKAFIHWAIEDELIKKNPFSKIKTRHIDGKRERLSVLELEKIEKMYEAGSLKANLQNVLRYFLFSCYTGLRYKDVKKLSFKHIKKRSVDRKEIEVIDIIMHKTELPVVIPLTSKAKDLMPIKINKNQKVFKTLTNQKTNDNLKRVIKEACIDKNITFHCSRHTFATMAIEMGIPIEIISKLLGHTELKTTQIYAKINDGLKYREMMKMDRKA